MPPAADAGAKSAFLCPVCGSDAYVAVHVRRPSGNWYRTPFHRCFGCSVLFEDPAIFGRTSRQVGDGVDRSPRFLKKTR
jgi:hypothetical protein